VRSEDTLTVTGSAIVTLPANPAGEHEDI
jgi:hypothetical protein